MIDIRELRKDPSAYSAKLARKGASGLVQELLEVDAAWRSTTKIVESLRAKQESSGKPSPDQFLALQHQKEQLQEAMSELAKLEGRRQELLDRVPNPPTDDVPTGGEDDFEVLREVGRKPSFAFSPRDHLDLAQAHGWIDVGRGTKVAGSRFVYRVGDLALLELALYGYALARVAAKGHVPVLPPILVRKEAMYDTGFFPTDKVNIYGVERDDLFLVGTSEVPVAAFHAQEILEELPLRYVAYSTCFRREAGAAGKDTRGMFRVHQFDKVEMFVYCTPETSVEEHDRLLMIEEGLIHELGLGTAITARAMIAILENFQDADGSIAVPRALWEFGAPRTIGQ